jgi:hypothetical protein
MFLDIGVFRVLRGYFRVFRLGLVQIQDDGNMENEIWGVGARGEEGGKGANVDGSGYRECRLVGGCFRVFRVLRAGISHSGKVVEIPRV